MYFFKDKIYIKSPKPLQYVDEIFVIPGYVSDSWLEMEHGVNDRISLDLIDIKAQTIMGTSIIIKPTIFNWLRSKIFGIKHFYYIFRFSPFGLGFIKDSEGLMTIKLCGWKAKTQYVYIPIIVKFFEPKQGSSRKIKSKHQRIGEMINQYENDLIKFDQEYDSIQKRRLEKNCISISNGYSPDNFISDFEVVNGVLEILANAEDTNPNYPFFDEDREEKLLEEKYKDAIEWRGPLLGAIIGRMGGFEFRIFSNDHDKHFHVIHRGKGINARFSFPEIELIDYKQAKTSINSREQNKIILYFKIPENFNKLKREFARRDTIRGL